MLLNTKSPSLDNGIVSLVVHNFDTKPGGHLRIVFGTNPTGTFLLSKYEKIMSKVLF